MRCRAPERLDDVLLDRLLLKRGEHLSLFTAPAALERDYDAVPESYEAVIDAVRQTTPCVILDLPHGWTPWIKAGLLAADEIVIVATPDLTILRNAKNIIELVKSARPNDTPPRLVINQVGMPKRPEIPAKDFAETMGMDPAAIIAFDPALFGQAANNGQMVIEAGAQGAGFRSRAPAVPRADRPHACRAPAKQFRLDLLVPQGQEAGVNRCSASAPPLSLLEPRAAARAGERAAARRAPRADASAPPPRRAAAAPRRRRRRRPQPSKPVARVDGRQPLGRLLPDQVHHL